MKKIFAGFTVLILTFIFGCQPAAGQTSSFTYQGKLTDSSAAANGQYDFTFKLFDAAAGGTQIGTDNFLDNVPVTGGIFTVNLNFSGNAFTNGAARFLEISVRAGASTGAFTTLTPRQEVTSSPFSIKSLLAGDSLMLGGMAANQFVLTGDSRLSDSRNPLPNSPNYIQNTTSPQTSSNFNVSGSGTANIFNASTQFNLGGSRVLSGSTSLRNLFAGVGAGNVNSTGFNNTFVGQQNGSLNTTGNNNSFFGTRAGENNVGGNLNSFFGAVAGVNSIGDENSFFGSSSGSFNQTGNGNSFFGNDSGLLNLDGSGNSFFGNGAGFSNTSGSLNTIIGSGANVAAGNLNNATAIGSGTVVSNSNTIVLGRSAGQDAVQIPGNLNVAGTITGNFSGTISTANNALNLGGIPANQYITITNGPANYIQNTTSPQSSSNFNISGNGTANIFNASTQFNLGGSRILSATALDNNLFAGFGAGNNNTFGGNNTFVGSQSGRLNTSGSHNSFFGQQAGEKNVDGAFNSFFGVGAGGMSNGEANSFFGYNSGGANQTGSGNSFFGNYSGLSNLYGSDNSFFGSLAGDSNISGGKNTIIGFYADVVAGNLTNATAIGSYSAVSQSNSLVLGSINGVNQATADTNVGIGTTAPNFRLDVADRIRIKQNPANTGAFNSAGIWFFQNTPNQERAFVGMENDNSVGLYGQNGGDWGFVMNTQTGVVSLRNLGGAGSQSLCRNSSTNQISLCSSSLRYKTNLAPFSDGLSFINLLRPISFDWKEGGMRDIGFGAEDVANINPLFVTYNAQGEVEGVKYDRLSVVFVNAFKEQQTQIEEQSRLINRQNETIKNQQSQLDALKAFVCSQNAADFCKSE